jgi:hypothetical protein
MTAGAARGRVVPRARVASAIQNGTGVPPTVPSALRPGAVMPRRVKPRSRASSASSRIGGSVPGTVTSTATVPR